MWRALFTAIGISLLILGLECLVLERAVLARESPTALPELGLDSAYALEPTIKIIDPPEWAPWTLLSAGAVLTLYSLSLNRG